MSKEKNTGAILREWSILGYSYIIYSKFYSILFSREFVNWENLRICVCSYHVFNVPFLIFLYGFLYLCMCMYIKVSIICYFIFFNLIFLFPTAMAIVWKPALSVLSFGIKCWSKPLSTQYCSCLNVLTVFVILCRINVL